MAKNCDLNYCTLCEHGRVEPDPDPFDWFNDDDEKVVCALTGKIVAGALRPYETDEVCVKDEYCPKKNG